MPTKTKTKTKTTAAAVSAVDVARFIAAHRVGTSAMLEKIRTVGDSLNSGSTNGAIAAAFATACATAKHSTTGKSAPLFVPADGFTSAVSQYAAAFHLANLHKLAADDLALAAAMTLCNGTVKATERDKFAAAFTGRSTAAFVKGCAVVLAAAKKAKSTAAATKGAKGATVKDKPAATTDKPAAIPAKPAAPVTFADMVAALDSYITAANATVRPAMVRELRRIVDKHSQGALTTTTPKPRPVVTITPESALTVLTNDADTARRAAAIAAQKADNKRRAALIEA